MTIFISALKDKPNPDYNKIEKYLHKLGYKRTEAGWSKNNKQRIAKDSMENKEEFLIKFEK